MPGKSKGRKMSRGRKKFYKKYKSYRNMAYTAFKGVKFLKGLVNVENHLYTKQINHTPSVTLGVTVLNDIPQGLDTDERSGNSILPKYFSGRAFCVQNPTAASTIVRITIIQDLHNQGVAPTDSEIFQNADVNSPLNVDNTDRFWILYDRTITLSQNGQTVKTLKWFKRLNFHMKYYGPVNTDYDQNACFILTRSNEATNTPVVDITNRLSFYDN